MHGCIHTPAALAGRAGRTGALGRSCLSWCCRPLVIQLKARDKWGQTQGTAGLLTVESSGCSTPAAHSQRFVRIPWRNDPHENNTNFVDVKIKRANLQLHHHLVTASLSWKSLPFSLKKTSGAKCRKPAFRWGGSCTINITTTRKCSDGQGAPGEHGCHPGLAFPDSVNPSPPAEVFQTLLAVCYRLYWGSSCKTGAVPRQSCCCCRTLTHPAWGHGFAVPVQSPCSISGALSHLNTAGTPLVIFILKPWQEPLSFPPHRSPSQHLAAAVPRWPWGVTEGIRYGLPDCRAPVPNATVAGEQFYHSQPAVTACAVTGCITSHLTGGPVREGTLCIKARWRTAACKALGPQAGHRNPPRLPCVVSHR